MVSNYSFDPKDVSSMSNSATPQSGQGGTPSDYPDSSRGGLMSYATPASGQPPVSQPPPAPSAVSTGGQRRLAPGTELSGARYRIDKLAAAGGMGAVYRAIDTRFNRPCAVKEMLDEFQNESERAQAVEWFSREATLLLDLNHPCIPRVRDFFVEGGKHYLVMDFIEGRTLGDVLEKEGNVVGINGAFGIPEARARSWAQQVCNVLSYLHRLSPPIIFRDLKPSNIMVTDRDEIKLIDFGIARTFKSQQQATVIMTLGYAPPEQLYGMPEPRSDLFALGATLHRVLTHHDAANNKPRIFLFPPIRTLRPDVSPALEQVIMKSLAESAEQRWASAAEMERALLNLPPITVVPPTGPVGGQGLPIPQRPSGQSMPASGMVPNTPVPPATQATTTTTGPGGAQIVAALGFLGNNQVDAAFNATTNAYGLEPNNALVHKLYGQIFARRQQAEPAIQAYNRSVQLNPGDAETHKLVGDVLLFLRQQASLAIPAYMQSLQLNPRDAEAHQRLAQCYEKTNQLELALREYQEAAKLSPKLPAIHFALGQLAFRLNQLPIAEHAFVQVLTINPADHSTRFLLSQVYERENKLEDAFRECSYVVGPLGVVNPAVQPMFQRLRARLGR